MSVLPALGLSAGKTMHGVADGKGCCQPAVRLPRGWTGWNWLGKASWREAEMVADSPPNPMLPPKLQSPIQSLALHLFSSGRRSIGSARTLLGAREQTFVAPLDFNDPLSAAGV